MLYCLVRKAAGVTTLKWFNLDNEISREPFTFPDDLQPAIIATRQGGRDELWVATYRLSAGFNWYRLTLDANGLPDSNLEQVFTNDVTPSAANRQPIVSSKVRFVDGKGFFSYIERIRDQGTTVDGKIVHFEVEEFGRQIADPVPITFSVPVSYPAGISVKKSGDDFQIYWYGVYKEASNEHSLNLTTTDLTAPAGRPDKILVGTPSRKSFANTQRFPSIVFGSGNAVYLSLSTDKPANASLGTFVNVVGQVEGDKLTTLRQYSFNSPPMTILASPSDLVFRPKRE